MAPAAVGVTLGLAQYLLYLGFYSDDAAISFAYARSIARGLPADVVTAGQPAADGYSNPTWTFLLSLGERMGVSAPVAAKILGALFLTGSIVLCAVLADRMTAAAWARWSPALVGASFTLVFWSASGLETSLVTVLALACTAILLAQAERPSVRRLALLVALALVLLMSRPDAAVYAVAVAASLLFGALRWRRPSRRGAVVTVGFLAIGAAAWARYRTARFGALLPTTVYAKVEPKTVTHRVMDALNPASDVWREIASFLIGHGLVVVVPLLIVGLVRTARGRNFAVAAMGLAAVALPLSEVDWMPEYRFFAPAIPFVFLLAAAGGEAVSSWMAPHLARWSLPWTRIAGAGVVLLLLTTNARLALGEWSSSWRGQVTRAAVADFANRLRDSMHALGVHDPLVMVPDVGGAVYDDDLRVLDSAGIIDEQVALDVRNHLGLQAYAFAERKPDAIATSPAFSYLWQFDGPTLLRGGYVPLDGVARPPRALARGIFVRRDLLIAPRLAGVTSGSGTPVEATAPAVAEPGGVLIVRTTWSARDMAGSDPVVTLREPGGAPLASARLSLSDPVISAAQPRQDEGIKRVVRIGVPPGVVPQTATIEVARDGNVLACLPVTLGSTGGLDTSAAATGRQELTALEDQADASPSARDQIIRFLQARRARELQRLVTVADAALDAGDIGALADAGIEASHVRGRTQPSAAERRVAARALRIPGADKEQRWQLTRAALAFDPTSRTAGRRLASARRAMFGAAPLPPADTTDG